MQDNEGFSLSTVRSAGLKMKSGIKSDCSISDKFSREDIARAWSEAYIKVFGGNHDSNSLSREFLNASHKDEIAKEKQRLNQEYIDKYEELVKHFNPSWWYGVSQSLAASFLFIFIGYLILKFNGV